MFPTPQQVSWSWGKYRHRLHNLKTVALVFGVWVVKARGKTERKYKK